MFTLQNKSILMEFSSDGSHVKLIDKVRGQEWVLDPLSIACQLPGDEREGDATGEEGQGLMLPQKALQLCETAAKLTYEREGRSASIVYHLRDDHIETVLLPDGTGDMRQVVLPGSFLPPDRTGMKYLYPIMQGMQWDLSGMPFEEKYREGAHVCFAMGMLGCLAKNGGMLLTVETRDNTLWWTGKDASERPWATNLQLPSLGAIDTERAVRIYFTDSNITAVAKRYRARVIERGRFKSWEEKIKERPGLERLFGSLMCFIGYMQDDLDYAHEFKKLKAMGFDRALINQVRFDNFDTFTMGGLPYINLDREAVQAIRDLGYDVGCMSYINARKDDESGEARRMFKINKNGSPIQSWAMDDHVFYECCTGEILERKRRVNAGAMSDMNWDHFDVFACNFHRECHALDHPSHMGKPLSSGGERDFIRQLFRDAQSLGGPVGSEGFNDVFSPEYDLGTVKAWPQYGPWQFWPVPLTMLVYHDSMLHIWWEVHNYNSNYFGATWGRGRQYQYGGGRPRLMSATDALYGSQPHVFPFGAQYRWAATGSLETVTFRFRLEDLEVQQALKLAKPVADLHRRIGMLEMVSFEFLTEDGYIQKTTFSDGTEVYANFGPQISRVLDGLGYAVRSESWAVKFPE